MTHPAGRLVVSIHDVAPSTLGETRFLLEALDRIGAAPRVLKVIPRADGGDDLRAAPALARLLAAEVGAGSEVVLHGYTHRAAGPLRGPWLERLRGRLLAGDAAEFLTLDDGEIEARLAAGRAILEECGLAPRGFCAPCWLASAQVPALLRRCGFSYYVSMFSLLDLQRGRRLTTPWFGYMGAGGFHERLVATGGYAGLAAFRGAPVVKVFLHPQGAAGSAACDRVLRVLAGLMRTRRLVTYGSLVAG
jgi:predicted deacetylase